MPVTVFERNESGAANASNGFLAGVAPFSKQFTKAICAEWLVITRRETLSCQRRATIGTREAFSMPGFVFIGDSTTGYDLVAFDTTGCEFLLITVGTVDLLFSWDETLGTNRSFANYTSETFLVPLSGLVFHFFGSSFEYFRTVIAARCKLSVIAATAIDLLSFGTKLFVD
uniref:Uncharacterized protein n=1 Tax=Cacopsylla melanoneura TaxID=428564 RepID=A0A8D9BU99_9HEMI